MLLILWFWPDGMTFKAIGLCVVLDLFVTVCMLITVRVLMILLYDAIILSHIRRTNRIRTLVYGVESKEVALVMRLQNSPHYDMCGFITYGRRLKYYEIAERPVYYFETEENIRIRARQVRNRSHSFRQLRQCEGRVGPPDQILRDARRQGVDRPADRRDRRRETGASGAAFATSRSKTCWDARR